MRTISFLLILSVSLAGNGQDNYQDLLPKRLKEIKKLKEFDNTPVVFSDSFRIKIYSSPHWEFKPYHPYQFLRDSAETKDLIRLLDDKHPFIRTYAFGALHNRKYKNLFPVLISNLADNKKFRAFTDDVGYDITVPDMMLSYVARDLSPIEKDSIGKLLITKHTHLKTLNEVLLFIKPKPELYQHIRNIALVGEHGKFSLIALSRYQNLNDLELIKEGFSMTDYYSGNKVFFMAIEGFNHPFFKNDLINFKSSINKGFDNQGLDFYFNALAKYRDPECLDVIQEFIDVKEYSSEYYKFDNLRMIRRSLKKYYYPEYQPLIDRIELEFLDRDDLEYYDNYLFRSPWNF